MYHIPYREMLEEMVKSVYGVTRKDSIKPKRGQKDKTVMVKIHCSIDPGNNPEDFGMLWGATVNWKQGGIKKETYVAEMLGSLVMNITGRVKEVLRHNAGLIPKVDIIFKMPSGKDHKMTVTYQTAIRATTT